MKDNGNGPHRIDDYVAQSLSAEVPPDVEERARQRLASLRERMSATELPGLGNTVMSIFRNTKIMKSLLWASPVAALAVIAVLFIGLNPWDRGSQAAYAAVVEQIQKALTMTFTATSEIPVPGQPPMTGTTKFEVKAPNLLRYTGSVGFANFAGVNVEGVMDVEKKKALLCVPLAKQYQEMDLSELPAELSQYDMIERMRSLPSRANDILRTREIGGRTVQGFHVVEQGCVSRVWVDAKTGDLVRVEQDLADEHGKKVMKMVLTDFHFNVALDDALFSLKPPQGYTKLDIPHEMTQPLEPSEKDLIAFLRHWTELGVANPKKTFPTGLSVIDIMKEAAAFGQSGKDQANKDGSPAAIIDPNVLEAQTREKVSRVKAEMRALEKSLEAYGVDLNRTVVGPAQRSNIEKPRSMEKTLKETMSQGRGLAFVMQMKPENDWHYAGKDVVFGAADKAIFWYKPDGLAVYRVIFGDLSVREMSAEEVAHFRLNVHLASARPSSAPRQGYAKIDIPPSMLRPPKEEDLLASLRDWVEWTGINPAKTFPPSLHMMEEIQKAIASPTYEPGGYHQGATQEEQWQRTLRMTWAQTFIMMLQPENDWHYAGKGVVFGAADKAIFWYKPDGSKTYRVIYGDLSVREMSPKEAAQLK